MDLNVQQMIKLSVAMRITLDTFCLATPNSMTSSSKLDRSWENCLSELWRATLSTILLCLAIKFFKNEVIEQMISLPTTVLGN